jgi:predicted ATPase
MLKEVSVDGFRSLNNFSLEIARGLNVFVGPNGAGKSNLVRFFEFLSYVPTSFLIDAVSRAGGAGELFSKKASGALNPKFSFCIYGEGRAPIRMQSEREGYIKYFYSATVSLASDRSTLYYQKQEFKFWHSSFDSKRGAISSTKPDVHFRFSIDRNDREHIAIPALNPAFVTSSVSKANIRQRIRKEFLTEHTLRHRCVFSQLSRQLDYLHAIETDIAAGKPLNIQPSEVKKAEDIASRIGIQPDGSGLAATIYASKRHSGQPRLVSRRVLSPRQLNELVRFTRLVNDQIQGIEVEPDTIQNKLVLYVTFKTKGGDLKLPISAVSDGTAKWFALVAAILEPRQVFLLEEPENFLHPTMQREVVNVIRYSAERASSSGRIFIITTHSETFLNEIKPDELILFDFKNGSTRARRLKKAANVEKEINRTGFGLGHYFVSGVLE